jgi:outer membrane protein insertion porin family
MVRGYFRMPEHRPQDSAGRRRTWPFYFLALLCLGGPWGLPAAAAAAEAAVVLRSVKITGAKTIPAKKVLEELSMPLPSRWPWKKPPPFRPEDLETDVERLKLFYQRRGFYHAHITPEVRLKDNRAQVVIKVEEGPGVKVTRLEVKMAPTAAPLCPGLDLGPLADRHPLKIGDRFAEEAYESLKLLYLNHLMDNGYPRAKVEGKVYLDEGKNTAEIHLTVTPGVLCYFGPATLKGKTETPEWVIMRKLTFKPGELFSFKELYESQRRLYSLDLFQSVILTPAEVPEGERHIPIVVEVKDKKKRSIKLGLGYGDEDEFRARVAFRFRNLCDGGRMLDLDTKYSRLEYRVEGTFFNPQLWATHNDLVVQTGVIRRYLPGFTDRAWFTQVRLERDLFWDVRGFLGHGLEFARPFNIPEETLVITETQTGKLYRASMAMGGLRRDTTDNPVDPHRGGVLSLAGDAAPNFLGSDIQFMRGVAEVRRYQSVIWSNFILAGKLKFGIIEPIQGTHEIPVFRRFFSGGYNSVRGYRLDYLGPRNTSGVPLGGNTILEGSLETRIPIYKEFRAVAFLDFGNVFLKPQDTDVGQLKYSSGFGLRYQTFFGPLGIDFGFPLNPINRRQDPGYRIHFTIGQAF